MPSISGILDNLDSTNAAIRRYSANRSVILDAANVASQAADLMNEHVEPATLARSLSAVSIVSSGDDGEEVQSIMDEDDQESDTISIILNSTEVYLADEGFFHHSVMAFI